MPLCAPRAPFAPSVLSWLAALLIAAPVQAGSFHTVAPGETLDKIARQEGVSPDALRKANGLSERDKVRPGQRLQIPSSSHPGPQGAFITYRVGEGTSLVALARRYRSGVEILRQANGLGPTQKLRPGQCLLIPAEGQSSTGLSPKQAAERRASCEASCSKGSVCASASKQNPQERWTQAPKQKGVVHIIRGDSEWKGRLVDGRGRALPAALKQLEKMMHAGGQTHKVDPGLLPLLTKVSDHFGGRPLRIVSGYRPPAYSRYTVESNHCVGKAVDFVVQDVPASAVRDFCHGFRNVGVGYYPNSGFIHLDVRSATTHWVDVSGPGEPPRYSSSGQVPEPEAQAPTSPSPN